jgi:hypothetical protein
MSEKLTHFYRALLNLGRSLAVCKEPKSLLEVVAQTLSPMVQFDLLALLLYDGTPESLSVHAITGEGRHLTSVRADSKLVKLLWALAGTIRRL